MEPTCASRLDSPARSSGSSVSKATLIGSVTDRIGSCGLRVMGAPVGSRWPRRTPGSTPPTRVVSSEFGTLDELEVARPPGAVECGGLRAVDPEVTEPATPRHRLDPARFVAGRRGRTEVQLDRAATELVHQLELRAQRRPML